eukprot:CAMPEP_0170523066 /NCGR_PEP_ID=MMETSP0209-20121228/8470_1 /TAXON_ID=665100 ORGANISM="Litonotus pictus, Strain P1" /NCGR_SAMPLE_ID=MMETSP0209 /ASSEMBLY_ACC=CAM_ASM_000301 /LENGTH=151 /DNA_ID=CAMNT_0010810917 /DNA_START=109 /DNA_END=560 /DNA_ORIENTATION=-
MAYEMTDQEFINPMQVSKRENSKGNTKSVRSSGVLDEGMANQIKIKDNKKETDNVDDKDTVNINKLPQNVSIDMNKQMMKDQEDIVNSNSKVKIVVNAIDDSINNSDKICSGSRKNNFETDNSNSHHVNKEDLLVINTSDKEEGDNSNSKA